jgi:hypothetical protein
MKAGGDISLEPIQRESSCVIYLMTAEAMYSGYLIYQKLNLLSGQNMDEWSSVCVMGADYTYQYNYEITGGQHDSRKHI